jgi:DNA topoisomerase-6 subunit B
MASGKRNLEAAPAARRRGKAFRPVTAEEMAGQQREISVSEFFTKNRHLLGFDNPRKALLTTVKEAVDNALDACEEAGILPAVAVSIRKKGANGNGNGNGGAAEAPAAAPPPGGDLPLFPAPGAAPAAAPPAPASDEDAGEDDAPKRRGVVAPPERFVVSVEDNGPGIVREQVGRVFGKLLYGSKFHRLRQSRGQQGIGISAAGMYGQLTTGKPVRIWTRTAKAKRARFIEMHMDLRKNAPEVTRDEEVDWEREHRTGTKVEIELEAKYQKGAKSVDDYLRQTALANPHVTLRYEDPEGSATAIDRAVKALPEPPREIQPHPYGVELGMLIQMLKSTGSKKLKAFLQNEFSRVSPRTATVICEKAGLSPTAWVARIAREEADRLHGALSGVRIQNPPTDCLSPIGETAVAKALERERPGAFVHAVTRPPTVYRGNPFCVEVGLAWGGEGAPADELASLYRFANRVPLLYQQSACAVNKAVLSCPWRSYGVDQSRGALPTGPLLVFVHLASVWVPFTSESKEAIAHYPEILKEIRLAVMECGRNLGRHLSRQRRMADAQKKKDYIAAYLPHIVAALTEILSLDEKAQRAATRNLAEVLEKSRTP